MSNKKAIKYFNELSFSQNKNVQDGELNNLKEKVQLEFSIQNSSKGFYSINVKLNDEQNIDFCSESKESFHEQILKFDKFFVCDYYFEKQQNLQIILNIDNNPININTTLGCIIGSRNCTYSNKYNEKETLIIKGEKMGKNDDFLRMEFFVKENGNDKSDYFKTNKLIFEITSKNKKLYTSEEINDEGKFAPVQIPTCLLEPFYTVSVYNSFDQLVGTFNKTIKEINPVQDNLELKIALANNNYLYLYDNSEIIENYTFLDYINAGVRICLSFGIDFTGSNGHPLDEGTLHSLKGDKPNDYERAIRYCGDIVAYYDYDQLFPVYGFGAIINSSNNKEASMCFNLNFLDHPDICTIDSVIKYYHECIEQDKLTFAGPTEFAPIIQAAISKIKGDNLHYYILMILTDGVIDDLQETIDSLVEASLVPLSVIIVGIGNADFKKMEILDGDEMPLISSSGQKRKRDLVQFVPFSKFENDEKKLGCEVLAEIPKQMVEYYKFKNLSPAKIKQQLNEQNNNNEHNPINSNDNNMYKKNEYPSFEELQKKNDNILDVIPEAETIIMKKQ